MNLQIKGGKLLSRLCFRVGEYVILALQYDGFFLDYKNYIEVPDMRSFNPPRAGSSTSHLTKPYINEWMNSKESIISVRDRYNKDLHSPATNTSILHPVKEFLDK